MPRLRRSDTSGPGIERRRAGRGFTYRTTEGDPVRDPEVLARIAHLAIPPAWRQVWISPWPNGHIQAMGTDAAGRRQYRYHDAWTRQRAREKFDHVLDFARALPKLRRAVADDLAGPALGRPQVLAAAVRLLDVGFFRIGGEAYAEEHETFGLATLLKRHVRTDGDVLVFDYTAKGAKERRMVVTDADIQPVIAALRRRRGGGDELLAWRDGRRWVDVRSPDINTYLKERAGDQVSAKDFRTWGATVLAATALALEAPPRPGSRSAGRRIEARVVREVAEYLGDTPAVARSSYVDPRVFDRFEAGETIGRVLARLGPATDLTAWSARDEIERAVVALLATPG